MSRGVNNREDVLRGLELPQSDIDGDTSFTLGFQLVKHPGVLERALAHLVSFFLELLDSSLINTTALENQVTSGSRLAGIDVADNDQ